MNTHDCFGHPDTCVCKVPKRSVAERLTLIATQAADIARTAIGSSADIDKLVALRNLVEEAIDQIERALEREA